MIRLHNRELATSREELLRQHDQARRDLIEEKKYSGLELMRDLLPVMDNLERAILAGRHSGDFDALMEAVEVIRDQFHSSLEKHGLREIAGVCNPFDPQVHEEVGKRESKSDPDGRVLEVVQQGYRMHDRVLRPSQVIVSRRPITPRN